MKERKVGDRVLFRYRGNIIEGKLKRITKTNVQIEFVTKTAQNLRLIWKKKEELEKWNIGNFGD